MLNMFGYLDAPTSGKVVIDGAEVEMHKQQIF